MTSVNLLPSEDRALANPVAEPLPTGGLLVAAALALAVVAVTVVVLIGNGIDRRQAKLDELQVSVAATTAQAGALQSFAALKEATEAQAQTVRTEAEGRLPWDQTLGDLSRVLPKGVRLTNLAASSSGAQQGTPTTGTDASTTGASATPSIALSGCAPSQDRVAELMSRLGDVRGVSGVSLASSQDGSSGGNGGGDAGCSPKQPGFDLTVTLGGLVSAAAATEAAGATASATPGGGA